ncbi:MAG: hypothetical protein KAG61_12630, partial [Bacteriovoracaceae bacterium]|nr:hypothetical protein [Bacteriovoracaceae bacterium]
PLTHIIVANVFKTGNIETLFNDFETKSSDYTPVKLKDEKNKLKQKFIDAGLIGGGGVVDSTVDLLNGSIAAGTSSGIDGLLDVIDVDTDATAEIKITLKGETTPFISDKVDGTEDAAVVPLDIAKLASAKETLTVLDTIRGSLERFSPIFARFSQCNSVKDDDGPCDIDTIHAAFMANIHPGFMSSGLTGEEDMWSMFCEPIISGDNDITSKTDCTSRGKVEFDGELKFSDVSIINYDSATKIAVVSFGVYFDGVYAGSEIDHFKFDDTDGLYKLFGNGNSHRVDFETQSQHSTEYNTTTKALADTYRTVINLWTHDDALSSVPEGATVKLVSDIFDGGEKQLYLVPVLRNSTIEYKLSASALPYQKDVWTSTGPTTTQVAYSYCDGDTNGTITIAELNSCHAYYDWRRQHLSLTIEEISKMARIEKVTVNIDGNDNTIYIKKPLIVNSTNASKYIPSMGLTVPEFCDFDLSSLDLSVKNGTLDYISLSVGYNSGGTWVSKRLEDYLNGTSSKFDFSDELAGFPSGYTNANPDLYLSSEDEYGGEFIRQINCQNW